MVGMPVSKTESCGFDSRYNHMNNNEFSKEKIFLDVEIVHEINYQRPFKWSDIKHLNFEDDDIIKSEYVDGFYSENNSWDAHYLLTVTRKVIETDEQYLKRQEKNKRLLEESKSRRFLSFRKLSEEFKDCCQYCGSNITQCDETESKICQNNKL